MRLVHCRVADQPRVGHDPIDEVVDHRGDVMDATEAVVQQRGLVGLHRTPRPRGPTPGRRLIRWMRRDPLRYVASASQVW